ncbi:MAG: radical SAM family heme chaperone HemW [Actinomycetaceae bacterium]|nr:radical SAM family heme chaperone HemW [Actinomycetaceae bacterium]
MSPALPEGIAWPASGAIDPTHAEVSRGRPFSLYIHVPFCTVRCGYCDFNTYTTGFGPGAEPGSYSTSVIAEARLARNILDQAGFAPRRAGTVFIGGGTPTLLDTAEIRAMLEGVREEFPWETGAEVTIEANPDSVDGPALENLAKAGITRVSFGMQSAVPYVLATLDRTHNPERLPDVTRWAREAGLSVSVDLIYGAPGESVEDWRSSVEAALALDTDHISTYALVIEEGTRMWQQVRRGELPEVDPDDEAAKYEIADSLLGEGGFTWYEISNWARLHPTDDPMGTTDPHFSSRHNLAYWRDHDWWGLGPGAHSHCGRLRWWNVKHPSAYAGRVAQGLSPAAGGEILDDDSRELERIMLAIRTAQGVDIPSHISRSAIASLIAQGLLEPGPALRGRAQLTLRGRLLCDTVTRILTDE